MPKAMVLDFGGVITQTLFETHRQTEVALGLAAGTLDWYGPFDPTGDALWCSMINDEISERDYWLRRAQEVGLLLGKDWNRMQDFVLAARSGTPMEIIRPEFLVAIGRAKEAGIRLAILSNELDLFYGADFREKLPFLNYFDAIIDATYTKILKPDRRAYAFITEALSIPAAECVFVDDQIRNIHGAEDFGMQCVHFDVTNPKMSYDEVLTKLGVTI